MIVPKEREVVRIKKAQRYSDCIYVCPNPSCRLGLSNATVEANRRKIYCEKRLNLPRKSAMASIGS